MRLLTLTILALFFTGVSSLWAADIGFIDKEELKAKLDSQDLVIVDVRTGRDWSSSEFMIKGATREDPQAVESWAGGYDKGKTIVLYCA